MHPGNMTSFAYLHVCVKSYHVERNCEGVPSRLWRPVWLALARHPSLPLPGYCQLPSPQLHSNDEGAAQRAATTIALCGTLLDVATSSSSSFAVVAAREFDQLSSTVGIQPPPAAAAVPDWLIALELHLQRPGSSR